MAVVSLNPAKLPEPPVPPGSHEAAFSAGPKPRDGASAAPSESSIVVPGILTRDGAGDRQPSLVAGVVPSRQNLMAGLRNPPPAPPPDPLPGAARVSSAPDPLLAGRLVYSIAIQMPNITSYSGSWMVWFAEREAAPNAPPGAVRPPVPLRKVDPRYVAAAADERVEGIVRLSAVIQKDGHVDAVAVVRRLDERLDRSAQEALAKWQFEPALRNGAPVAVDAIFEVPFRLLPRLSK
jgi:TonB family protein